METDKEIVSGNIGSPWIGIFKRIKRKLSHNGTLNTSNRDVIVHLLCKYEEYEKHNANGQAENFQDRKLVPSS
jgi:hypothetical protein